jgi:hypothetical protein
MVAEQTAWATVNQLTLQPPAYGNTRVQQNLFMGNHLHDQHVPLNVPHNPRLEARAKRLAAEAAQSPYATTHKTMYAARGGPTDSHRVTHRTSV